VDGVLLTVMFLGTSGLAYLYRVEPRQEETVISQFARTIFADPRMTWAYYLVQTSTAAIMVLAANTSFADFPRLAGLMARDRFLPQQFRNVGDRLVFSNGLHASQSSALVRSYVRPNEDRWITSSGACGRVLDS